MRTVTTSPAGLFPSDGSDNFSWPEPPDFAIAFIPADAGLEPFLARFRAGFPTTLLIGATASQQFVSRGLVDAGVVMLFWMENPEHGIWCELVGHDGAGRIDSRAALRAIKARHTDSALILVDGVHFPVHALLDQIRADADFAAVNIVGALAAKPYSPETYLDDNGAWIVCGDRVHRGQGMIIGFEGVDMDTTIVRGWEPASPVYTVTDAEGAVLRAIDGKPAADWYRDYFTIDGELAELPMASLGFPLIIDGPDPSRKGIYRAMTVFDQPPGCVTLAGDVHVGDRLRLGIGDAGSLIDASRRQPAQSADACLLFSCVAREMVLGDAAEAEILALRETLGDTPIAGFFSFGEIGPSEDGALAYYNQTGVMALLKERLE